MLLSHCHLPTTCYICTHVSALIRHDTCLFLTVSSPRFISSEKSVLHHAYLFKTMSFYLAICFLVFATYCPIHKKLTAPWKRTGCTASSQACLRIFPSKGSPLSVVCSLGTSASPRRRAAMQSLRTHPRPTESQPSMSAKPQGDVYCCDNFLGP